MDTSIKNNREFIFNLIQRGKEAGMIWNGVAWVPAGADGKPSKVSKGPKITEISRVSKGKDTSKGITEYASKNFSKSFTKTFDSIASEISSIKNILVTFVKGQEKIKRKTDEEKLREKNEAYKAKYKKAAVKKEPEKISEEPKKSFFEFLKDLFGNILKFFAIGFGLIGLSKFFNIGDVKETIKNLIVKIITTISDLIEKGADLVHDLLKPGETSNKIIEFIEKVIGSIIQVVSDFIEFVRNFVQKIASDEKLLGNVQSIIENIFVTLFTVIKTTVESLKDTFQKIGPELTEGIIKGITFILEGVASGIQFLTSLVNDPAFRQSFADVFQAMYDLIASIFDIEVPVPVFGTVKLGTIVAIVTASMVAFDAVMKGIVGYLIVRAARSGMKSGIQAAGATKTGCSGILGGPSGTDKPGNKPVGKGRRFLDALGGTLGVVQTGGLIIGAGTAAYAFAESSERGNELRQKYETAPTKDPSSTVSSTSTSTPTSTSASAAVPSSMSTPSTSGSTTSPTPTSTTSTSSTLSASNDALKKMVVQSGSNMQIIEAALRRNGITDAAYIKATLANVMKESGGKPIAENMNYGNTPNDRIRKIFGQRAARFTDEQLNQIKREPSMMGELMYGYQTAVGQKMGNTQPGDGFLYRGRGFIQLTGKNNYAAASNDIYKDDRLVKNPDLLLDPMIAAEVTAWYMKKGRARMAQILGMSTENLSQEQADLLATSQIAGGDIRKKGAIGQEIMTKVASYSGGKTPMYTGSEAGVATPVSAMPSMAGFTSGPVDMAKNIGQSFEAENPFSFLKNLIPNAAEGKMDSLKDIVLGADKSPSMAPSNKNMAQFLDSASQELTKLMQDNELLGMFFKDQTTKAGSKSQDVIAATNTNTKVNPEINSGIGSVYDEEFVKKVFG